MGVLHDITPKNRIWSIAKGGFIGGVLPIIVSFESQIMLPLPGVQQAHKLVPLTALAGAIIGGYKHKNSADTSPK